MLRITKYADRLLDGLENLKWPEKVKTMQRNWIGRSEGVEATFTAIDPDGNEHPLVIYTTRPDTLFGATYMVLAPEHPLVPILMETETRGGRRRLRRSGTNPAGPRPDHRSEGEIGSVHRLLRSQPDKRREDSHMGRGLRSDGLRDWGDHGGSSP